MVKIDNGWRVYTVEEDGVGELKKSAAINSVYFDVRCHYLDTECHKRYETIVIRQSAVFPVYLNSREYRLESDDDVIAFRAALEAALVEDVLDCAESPAGNPGG